MNLIKPVSHLVPYLKQDQCHNITDKNQRQILLANKKKHILSFYTSNDLTMQMRQNYEYFILNIEAKHVVCLL